MGVDAAYLAASARRAGYQVFSVDYFGDQDLKDVCTESISIITQKNGQSCGCFEQYFDPSLLIQSVRNLLEKHTLEVAILSSGLEDSPAVLKELDELVPILGNSPESIYRTRNKKRFFEKLKILRVPHPETKIVVGIMEAKRVAKDLEYPLIVKPIKGFGGVGVKKVENNEELEYAIKSFCNGEALIQEYIRGTNASASVLAVPGKAVTLTVNEQLIGMSELGQIEPFGYCGNVVPLLDSEAVISQCKHVSEKVVLALGLVGSNGVDFVVSEDGVPYVVEVNPRFQGTLECVERVLDINLVDAHAKACTYRVLPDVTNRFGHFCTRLILFALERSIVPNLTSFFGVRDIPLSGTVVERSEPVCSVVAEGKSRLLSLNRARVEVDSIFKSLKSVQC